MTISSFTESTERELAYVLHLRMEHSTDRLYALPYCAVESLEQHQEAERWEALASLAFRVLTSAS